METVYQRLIAQNPRLLRYARRSHAPQFGRHQKVLREPRLGPKQRWAAKAALMAGRPTVQCHYCGVWINEKSATLDHVVARSRGGSNCLSNLLLCCYGCNQEKGSVAYSKFVARIAA